MSILSRTFLARTGVARTAGLALLLAPFLAPLLTIGACSAPGETPWSKNVSILIGERELQERAEWAPVEQHPLGGIEFDSRDPETGWGYEVGLSYSENRETQSPVMSTSSRVGELWGGGRKTFSWPNNVIHPYVSAGATAVYGDKQFTSPLASDMRDDLEPGVYAQVGIYGYLDEVLIGVGYRMMREDFITNDGLNLDYDQWLVRIGLSF